MSINRLLPQGRVKEYVWLPWKKTDGSVQWFGVINGCLYKVNCNPTGLETFIGVRDFPKYRFPRDIYCKEAGKFCWWCWHHFEIHSQHQLLELANLLLCNPTLNPHELRWGPVQCEDKVFVQVNQKLHVKDEKERWCPVDVTTLDFKTASICFSNLNISDCQQLRDFIDMCLKELFPQTIDFRMCLYFVLACDSRTVKCETSAALRATRSPLYDPQVFRLMLQYLIPPGISSHANCRECSQFCSNPFYSESYHQTHA